VFLGEVKIQLVVVRILDELDVGVDPTFIACGVVDDVRQRHYARVLVTGNSVLLNDSLARREWLAQPLAATDDSG